MDDDERNEKHTRNNEANTAGRKLSATSSIRPRTVAPAMNKSITTEKRTCQRHTNKKTPNRNLPIKENKVGSPGGTTRMISAH
jgi:hypothetical protein